MTFIRARMAFLCACHGILLQVCCLCFHHSYWLSRWDSSCFTMWRVFWWFTIGTSWSPSTASSGSRRGSMNWTAESCTQEAQKYVRQWEDLQYSTSDGQGRRSWQSVTLSRISKYISEFYVPVKLHTCQTLLVATEWGPAFLLFPAISWSRRTEVLLKPQFICYILLPTVTQALVVWSTSDVVW